jgi:hypothetical protein
VSKDVSKTLNYDHLSKVKEWPGKGKPLLPQKKTPYRKGQEKEKTLRSYEKETR